VDTSLLPDIQGKDMLYIPVTGGQCGNNAVGVHLRWIFLSLNEKYTCNAVIQNWPPNRSSLPEPKVYPWAVLQMGACAAQSAVVRQLHEGPKRHLVSMRPQMSDLLEILLGIQLYVGVILCAAVKLRARHLA